MSQKIAYTTRRSGIFYVQFWCDNKLIKNSLKTDSIRQARFIMTFLNPHIVSCINKMDSIDKFKKMVRGIIKMKNENDLLEEHATSELILRSFEQSKAIRHQLLNESSYSPEETIEGVLEIINMLENPLDRFKLEKKFVDNFLAKPDSINAINQGTKTKELLTKEALKRWEVMLELIKLQCFSSTYQDEKVNSILTRHNTQSNKAFTELTAQAMRDDIAEINITTIEQIDEPKQLLLSELHPEHREYKTNLHKTKNKSNDLTPEFRKILQRQNKYCMKFRAVAGDIDILSASKDSIFKALIDLFDWPDENQAGSTYNSKLGANKGKSPSQEWYDDIAMDLDVIAEDEAIKKSVGTVGEVHGWLQELYRYAISKEYITYSPVTTTTAEYNIREKQAKRIRAAYSADEVIKILDYVTKTDHRLKWPVILMCYTGCRNSELYRITTNDINLETQSIYINGTKTSAAKRYIPLAKGLEKRGFLELIKNKSNLTPILNGTTPFHLLNQEILKICKDLNIPEILIEDDTEEFRSFYSLRKSFRTYATHNCSNSDLIEVLIGHKVSGNSTKRAYQDTRLLAKAIEPMRPIVDNLPW